MNDALIRAGQIGLGFTFGLVGIAGVCAILIGLWFLGVAIVGGLFV